MWRRHVDSDDQHWWRVSGVATIDTRMTAGRAAQWSIMRSWRLVMDRIISFIRFDQRRDCLFEHPLNPGRNNMLYGKPGTLLRTGAILRKRLLSFWCSRPFRLSGRKSRWLASVLYIYALWPLGSGHLLDLYSFPATLLWSNSSFYC